MQTYHQNRPTEQGNIVSFMVVGLVIISLLVGSVIAIKSRSNQIANTPPQTSQQSPDKEDISQSKDEDTESAESKQTPVVPQLTSNATDNTIAATGPAEVFASTLIFGLITIVLVWYIQSRKQIVRK